MTTTCKEHDAFIARLQEEVTFLKQCQELRRINTSDYRDAVSGEGPHAATWSDKPHRLLYDVCHNLDVLQAIVDKLPKTADGVPVHHGQQVWFRWSGRITQGKVIEVRRDSILLQWSIDARPIFRDLDMVYSTRGTAELETRKNTGRSVRAPYRRRGVI